MNSVIDVNRLASGSRYGVQRGDANQIQQVPGFLILGRDVPSPGAIPACDEIGIPDEHMGRVRGPGTVLQIVLPSVQDQSRAVRVEENRRELVIRIVDNEAAG